jgi:hypothetical protein
MVLMAIGGGPLIRSRMRAIARDEDSDAFRRRASDSLLRASIRTRIALGLAIIYLMIAKVGLGGSLLAAGVMLLAGVITSVYNPRPKMSACENGSPRRQGDSPKSGCAAHTPRLTVRISSTSSRW